MKRLFQRLIGITSAAGAVFYHSPVIASGLKTRIGFIGGLVADLTLTAIGVPGLLSEFRVGRMKGEIDQCVESP
tara:strand:- start:175 stop:396 length:222 start_codon:yes stop_codon:yes gene_type:complete